MSMSRFASVAALAAGMTGLSASGQTLTTELVAGGFIRPIFVAHAPGDTERIFVIEQIGVNDTCCTGAIKTVDLETGAILGTLLEQTVSPFNIEQGLLGLAFHPNFQENGLLYINYTGLTMPGGSRSATYVDEFCISDEDPNTVDPMSRRPIFSIEQPRNNHNSGWLGFGPNDGYLYITLGDGGGANDPEDRAQNLADPLGSILRIDVDGDDFPADPAQNYAVPPSNPFVGVSGAAPEIWVYGVRNPYRGGFDTNGDMFFGDVGQNRLEEVNFIPAGSGGGMNFGWDCYEGTRVVGAEPNTCEKMDVTFPIFEYDSTMVACSVIGGNVYRGGEIPGLDGTYFFGDFCSSQFWGLRVAPDGSIISNIEYTSDLAGPETSTPVGFGNDAMGNVYICSFSGNVSRIVGVAPTSCNAADIAEPFGTHDIADVVAFLQLFGAMDPASDLAAPMGEFDIADVVTFLQLFGEGCPK
ncbi:MAG: hypothetical protein CMJ31_10150 [Phycisphaerae bacterium]|nr:hypothetical protein [Phycisphaerae bacterium]